MYKFYKKIRLKIIPHRHYISGAEKFSLCEKTGHFFLPRLFVYMKDVFILQRTLALFCNICNIFWENKKFFHIFKNFIPLFSSSVDWISRRT